jgi:hypothetical protein
MKFKIPDWKPKNSDQRQKMKLGARWCFAALAACLSICLPSAARTDDEDTKVKHPERFTTVKEWDLEATWSAGGEWNQLVDKTNTSAKVSFSGALSAVLSANPEESGWSLKDPGRANWSASLDSQKKIVIPDLTPFEWTWKTEDEQDRNDPPSAVLAINLKRGTFDLGGALYYSVVRTRLDDPTRKPEKQLDSVPFKAIDAVFRKTLYLPESGNDLSGSDTFPHPLGAFSELEPTLVEKGPKVPGAVPWAELHLSWTLKPHQADTRFEYRPSPSNIDQLVYTNLIVGHEVSKVPNSDLWFLHSNWEGQVYVDGKAMLQINKTVRPATVKGQYPIRRLARSWTLDDRGNILTTYDVKADSTHLPMGWIFDSNQGIQDWLDLAPMGAFNVWEHKGQLDEFLVGVVDSDPLVKGAPANTIGGSADAMAAAKAYPQDEYFEHVAGLPEFKFLYVAFLIETRPFPGHPMVYRVTYFSEGPFDLSGYIVKYQRANKPAWENYPWGGTSGWKEVVKNGETWKVVDFKP